MFLWKIIKYIPKKLKSFLIAKLGIKDLDEKICSFNYQATVLSKYQKQIKQVIKMLARGGGGMSDICFNSASLEDVIVFLYFNQKKDGFYIDIGAHDGITLSNTYALEQLGWNGICVEPNPDIFYQLGKNRKSMNYNVAISNQHESGIKFAKITGIVGALPYPHSMLSVPETDMLPFVKKMVYENNGSIEYITVKSKTFSEIMLNHPNITYIDFLSIDVEGGEINVLKSIDFDKYHFGFIAIENNYVYNDNTLRDYMDSLGYSVFMDIQHDIFFIPKQ